MQPSGGSACAAPRSPSVSTGHCMVHYSISTMLTAERCLPSLQGKADATWVFMGWVRLRTRWGRCTSRRGREGEGAEAKGRAGGRDRTVSIVRPMPGACLSIGAVARHRALIPRSAHPLARCCYSSRLHSSPAPAPCPTPRSPPKLLPWRGLAPCRSVPRPICTSLLLSRHHLQPSPAASPHLPTRPPPTDPTALHPPLTNTLDTLLACARY